jgi:RNA polymerase sigma-54 factor
MDQEMQLQPVQEQTMTVKVSPTLIMVNQLLALSSLELQRIVHLELEDNPALESDDTITCTSCGAGTTGRFCPVCLQAVTPSVVDQGPHAPAGAESNGAPAEDEFDLGFEAFYSRANAAAPDDEDFDPLTLVATESNVYEQLLTDLVVSLPEEDHPIAEYLMGNLDEQGFLSCSPETAARELEVPLERVERVLKVLQRIGPAGVGARDLRECLLIQLEEMRERGHPEIPPCVEQIIRDHLTELGEHKYTIIAQALGVSYNAVVEARDFIKHHMQPRPLQEPPYGRNWRSPSLTKYVIPDVIIHMRDGRLEAEVVETYRFNLRINPVYQRLASENGHNGLSEVDREHIRRYVNRSKLFIHNINQRRETIRRITECLIVLQEDFIKYGVRYLKPLTRAQVAQYLGIHESTVSRATANKYVMLPNKQVIPFSDFFTASLSAKDAIKEIITAEGRPLTDKEIVDRLRAQGIRVARRTVTKYRNQLGILPSTFR